MSETDLDRAIEARFEELRQAELDEGDEPLNEKSVRHAKAFLASREWGARPAITCDSCGMVSIKAISGPRLLARFFDDGRAWLGEGSGPVRETTITEICNSLKPKDDQR